MLQENNKERGASKCQKSNCCDSCRANDNEHDDEDKRGSCGGDKSALDVFKKNVTQDINIVKGRNAYRAYEVYEAKINLFRAMVNPELSKHVRFYAPFMVPTYVFQQKTSFSINLNANVTNLTNI